VGRTACTTNQEISSKEDTTTDEGVGIEEEGMSTKVVTYSFFCLAVSNLLTGQETTPSALIDIERLASLTLTDLGWQEESRRQVAVARVIGGSWKGPHFAGYRSDWEVAELDLSEYAKIYLPASGDGELHQLVTAVHYDSAAAFEPPLFLLMAAELGVAAIVHGEKEVDWHTLGFSGRNALMARSYTALQRDNLCEPHDYRFANYMLALAETNIMALTLLSRILQAEGFTPGDAGLLGVSKEGFAAWCASAVDDRFVAVAPGGWPFEDLARGISALEDNWGCAGSMGDAMTGPELLALRNWLAVRREVQPLRGACP
jgi:hypothetical protein